jgi:hypothetical protein
MTRTYALCRLLEHGPLTWREVLEVTGWSYGVVKSAIWRAMQYGWIEPHVRRGTAHYVYELA